MRADERDRIDAPCPDSTAKNAQETKSANPEADAANDIVRGLEGDEVHAEIAAVGLRFMMALMSHASEIKVGELGVDEQSAIAYTDNWLEDRFKGALWGESLPRKTKGISRQQREFRRNHRHWDCTIAGVPPGAAMAVRAEGWIKVSDDFEMRAVPAARWRGWFKSAIKRAIVCR
ncbi:hypothetical protein C8J57DRAFT_1574553 [Mycena rebaudengoi]|nr:hypothetical protein C8J57DRAFT_1574553 [Mycena rebaudengoi]